MVNGQKGANQQKMPQLGTHTALSQDTGVGARPCGRSEARLSIVVPLFNDARKVVSLHGHIVDIARRLKAMRELATEVVYVDDGSRDATLAAAQGLEPDSLDVQVISLSRNFGKEAALL